MFVATEMFVLLARMDVIFRSSSWMTHVACMEKASWIGVGMHLIINKPSRELYSQRESKSCSQWEFLVRQTENCCGRQGMVRAEECAFAANLGKRSAVRRWIAEGTFGGCRYGARIAYWKSEMTLVGRSLLGGGEGRS